MSPVIFGFEGDDKEEVIKRVKEKLCSRGVKVYVIPDVGDFEAEVESRAIEMKNAIASKSDVVLVSGILANRMLQILDEVKFDVWCDLVRKHSNVVCFELRFFDCIFLLGQVNFNRAYDVVKESWRYAILKKCVGRCVEVSGSIDDKEKLIYDEITRCLNDKTKT